MKLIAKIKPERVRDNASRSNVASAAIELSDKDFDELNLAAPAAV